MNFKKRKNSINLNLSQNEQITLKFSNSKYDIAKKLWGYYVTPSFQHRCKLNRLKVAIVLSKNNNQFNFVLVNNKKKKFFKIFLKKNNYKIIHWLDTDKKFIKFF